MTTETIILALVTGGVGAALVKLLDNIVQWWLKRKEDKDKSKKTEKTAEEKRIDAIAACVAILSLDRLTFVCKQAIHRKHITIADRQRIHAMHRLSHAIGVNGDLDDLISMVDKLDTDDPLADDDDELFETVAEMAQADHIA